MTETIAATTSTSMGGLAAGQRWIEVSRRVGRRTDRSAPAVGDRQTVALGRVMTAPGGAPVAGLVSRGGRDLRADVELPGAVAP